MSDKPHPTPLPFHAPTSRFSSQDAPCRASVADTRERNCSICDPSAAPSVVEPGMPFYFHGIIGRSPGLASIIAAIRKVADCDATVLVEGESGTGKEVVSRALHQLSPRRNRPFTVINCGTIVDTLMESELFGHERGAFTGAIERKAGKFEIADQGTVFLDEIPELPLPLQPKLLRIIQEREFTRVGGAKPLKTDIRIIAATNHEINAMVDAGQFREDLYYRLKVVRIQIPPLRERTEDIAILAQHFLKKYASRYHRRARRFSESVVDMLSGYHWPGNVRDLEHVVERAVIMSDHEVIQPGDIQFEMPMDDSPANSWSYRQALEDFQRKFLLRALANCKGNKRETARVIGISHAKLYRLLQATRIL